MRSVPLLLRPSFGPPRFPLGIIDWFGVLGGPCAVVARYRYIRVFARLSSDIEFWGGRGGAGRRRLVRWLRGANWRVWARTRWCRPGGGKDRLDRFVATARWRKQGGPMMEECCFSLWKDDCSSSVACASRPRWKPAWPMTRSVPGLSREGPHPCGDCSGSAAVRPVR